MIILQYCREYTALHCSHLSHCCFPSSAFLVKGSVFFNPTSGEPCGRLHRSWGTAPTQTRLICSRAAPEPGSTATSAGWSRPARPSPTRQTSTSSHSCISALSASRGWGAHAVPVHWAVCGWSLWMNTHSSLVSGFTQYHQVPDEYFTSAVVLSLILAALFGLVYLLIIPQYVQLPLFFSLMLFLSAFISWPDSLGRSGLLNQPFFLSLLFPFRGTVVLVLLVFCICFLVACIMYLHITRVQVNTVAFSSLPHLSEGLPFHLVFMHMSSSTTNRPVLTEPASLTFLILILSCLFFLLTEEKYVNVFYKTL